LEEGISEKKISIDGVSWMGSGMRVKKFLWE
jgi:hypothetical protein